MKINITKKEYRLLIDVLSIATWVMNSHRTQEDPRTEPYEELEQKFMSYAKDFGFKNLIVYDKKFERYFPTKQYEDAGTDTVFIDEYEDEVFWEKLCTYLAQRDLVEEKGIDVVENMDRFERFNAIEDLSQEYSDEFEKNGIKNLRLLKDGEAADHPS